MCPNFGQGSELKACCPPPPTKLQDNFNDSLMHQGLKKIMIIQGDQKNIVTFVVTFRKGKK